AKVNPASISDVIVKPLLRGHFHQEAFFFALGGCVMLLAYSPDQAHFWTRLIYAISLTGLLGVSALYHRIHWPPKKRVWMKRLDHSFIFILIAGTGTPIFYLGLPPDDS